MRRPWLPTTDRTVNYMRATAARDRSSGAHGPDGQGRLILDFVRGSLAIHDAPLRIDVIRAAGAVIRSIPMPAPTCRSPPLGMCLFPRSTQTSLCDKDLATCNPTIDGDRLVLIDWDGAGPSTRLWHGSPRSWAATARTTNLRGALPAAMGKRDEAMHDLLRRSTETGREPWSSMYAEGHGRHWYETSAFITSIAVNGIGQSQHREQPHRPPTAVVHRAWNDCEDRQRSLMVLGCGW